MNRRSTEFRDGIVYFHYDNLVQGLNREYRQVDGTTNVLSFANLDSPPGAAPDAPRLLGDVILARETIQKEACEQDKTMADHLSHLVVHGVLHLLGYDHQDGRDADRMEHLERTILNRLGVADPHRRSGVPSPDVGRS